MLAPPRRPAVVRAPRALPLRHVLFCLALAAGVGSATACGTDITAPKHGGLNGINPSEGGPGGYHRRNGGPTGFNPRLASDHAPTAQYGLGYDMNPRAQGGPAGHNPRALGGGAGGFDH